VRQGGAKATIRRIPRVDKGMPPRSAARTSPSTIRQSISTVCTVALTLTLPLYVASGVDFFDSSRCLWAICAPQGVWATADAVVHGPAGAVHGRVFSRRWTGKLSTGGRPRDLARSIRFWRRSSSSPGAFEPVGERRARCWFVRSCSPDGCPCPGLFLEPAFARRGT